MYTVRNFKSKKEFKQAVELYVTTGQYPERAVTYYQPGPFGGNEPRDGIAYFEGPHYPQPHRWYAKAQLRDGVVVKVF